jgi:DnaJ-class molecular chaperone
MMVVGSTLLFVSFIMFFGLIVGSSEIYDPRNIFCGSINCYDVLGLNRSATLKDIKKAFRVLSLTKHPDKNKDDNATEQFKSITKAHEVLGSNESRTLFDYYLDHPKV